MIFSSTTPVLTAPAPLGWKADIVAWREVIEVNLFGAFYCAHEALKRMVPQKSGVVLSTTSVHEEIAWSGYSAYTSSKAAVSMLTKTLAQEAAPHGVRVLAVVRVRSKRRSTVPSGAIAKT